MTELPTEREIMELLVKLNNLTLTPGQRALLTAILKVASDVTEGTEVSERQAFDKEFAKSFTPGKIKLIMDYAARPYDRSRGDRVNPAMISRSGGRDGDLDDNDDE